MPHPGACSRRHPSAAFGRSQARNPRCGVRPQPSTKSETRNPKWELKTQAATFSRGQAPNSKLEIRTGESGISVRCTIVGSYPLYSPLYRRLAAVGSCQSEHRSSHGGPGHRAPCFVFFGDPKPRCGGAGQIPGFAWACERNAETCGIIGSRFRGDGHSPRPGSRRPRSHERRARNEHTDDRSS